MDELTNESLRDALEQFVNTQTMFSNLMQGHQRQNEKIDALLERLRAPAKS